MRVVFRTEGNHKQGMGDLWGSIALADECARQRDKILFVLSGGEEAIATVKGRGYQFYKADSPAIEQEILRAFRPDVIIVNKLNSPAAYIRSLRKFTGLIVTIDDSGEGASCADLKINVLYHVSGAVTDPQYISLRREFQEFHGRTKTVKKEVQELLITQGGSDTYGFTPRIVRALEKVACRPHGSVVIGPAFRHHAELEKAVAASTLDLRIIFNAHNMAELMAEADLAITAGGLTMFEVACVGTPSLVICAEPFEMETAARMESAGAVVSLGFGADVQRDQISQVVDALALDVNRRKRMSDCGKKLIDGRGCERIISLIKERIRKPAGICL